MKVSQTAGGHPAATPPTGNSPPGGRSGTRTRPTGGRWAGVVRRVERATPAGRDRVVDGLRVLAMAGVVLGHWLVTGLRQAPDGALHQASPLAALPGLAPVTWLLETLGLFFFVSGYAATRSLKSSAGRGTGAWLLGRLTRLVPPVLVLAAVWTAVLVVLRLHGVQQRTLWTVGKLAMSPLWFVAVLVGLTVLTPLALAAVRRCGAWAAAGPLAVVALVDLVRFQLWPGCPGVVGWLNIPAGWLVPYLLGIAVARGHLRRPFVGASLLVVGAAATLALVIAAGYPVSMVGVPGEGRSNLDPPSLVVACLAVAQIGAALCLWRRLTRLLRRPALWTGVAVVNLGLFTVFLWHETALLVVACTTRAVAGPLPGMVDPPAGAGWIPARIAWFPALAAVLAVLCEMFQPVERVRRRGAPSPASHGYHPDQAAAVVDIRGYRHGDLPSTERVRRHHG